MLKPLCNVQRAGGGSWPSKLRAGPSLRSHALSKPVGVTQLCMGKFARTDLCSSIRRGYDRNQELTISVCEEPHIFKTKYVGECEDPALQMP